MDFSEYLSKTVKIDLSSGWYYCGNITEVDKDFLKLIDKKGSSVTIAIKDILSLREVSHGL